MKRQRLFSLMAMLSAFVLSSHAFEYRIVSNVTDCSLDGAEILLTNDSDWITEDFGEIKNGIIDIKGESNRSFPATLRIRNTNSEKPLFFNISLIVEPGTIVVDTKSKIPLSGGELNERMKDWVDRMNTSGDIQESHAVCMDVFEKNVSNGLGEFVLINYGRRCSPKEWTKAISLLDEETRNLPGIEQLTERKEQLSEVWRGQPFKDISGKDLHGNSINLSEYVGKGKYVVADLWASWCGPCIKLAIEVLKPLYEKYKDNPDVQFVGIAMDDISKVVEKHDIQWPQIMDCDNLRATYVIYEVPETIIFGPDGTILQRYVGEYEIDKILEKISTAASSDKTDGQLTKKFQ